LVRSPTLTNGISGVSVNGSSPDSRSSGLISGIARGVLPRTASAMARMCSGVVPQQPPTMLTSPARRTRRDARHVLGLFVVVAELVRQAGIRIGADQRAGDAADLVGHAARYLGRAEAQQLSRSESGLGVETAIPEPPRESGRPRQPADLSVIVPEIITGTSTPLLAGLDDGVDRRLALKTCRRSSPISSAVGPPVRSPHLLGVGLGRSST
jgi:hypothetical protein